MNVTLQEGKLLLSCTKMERELPREKIESAFRALMVSKLHQLILEGLGASEPFICESLDCMLSIYVACYRPYLLNYVTPEIFLNPELWSMIFDLSKLGLGLRCRRLQLRTLAVLACHVPSFSNFLLGRQDLLTELLRKLSTSEEPSERLEVLLIFKCFLSQCRKLTAAINTNIVKIMDDFSVEAFKLVCLLLARLY